MPRDMEFHLGMLQRKKDLKERERIKRTGSPSSVKKGGIPASAFSMEDIAVNPISAATITANPISAGTIATGGISAASIAANPISAGTIATGGISAASIAANPISAGTIATGGISAATVPAGVVSLPKEPKRLPSSVERIWGRDVVRHGYAGIPSILIRAQKRLGLSPTQMNIIIQLLDYWHEPTRKPFPSKKELADRINVTAKTIQNNIRQLEEAGLLHRQIRRNPSGDFNSNIYNLEPLVKKVQSIEPDFNLLREARDKARKSAESGIINYRNSK